MTVTPVEAGSDLNTLRNEMTAAINLYLEALAKVDVEEGEEIEEIDISDYAVVVAGISATGDPNTYFYRLDASGPPHVQLGMARILSAALES